MGFRVYFNTPKNLLPKDLYEEIIATILKKVGFFGPGRVCKVRALYRV